MPNGVEIAGQERPLTQIHALFQIVEPVHGSQLVVSAYDHALRVYDDLVILGSGQGGAASRKITAGPGGDHPTAVFQTGKGGPRLEFHLYLHAFFKIIAQIRRCLPQRCTRFGFY